MAEPGQQRARQQRIDLVVFGDQDREAFVPAAGAASSGNGSSIAADAASLKRAASDAARSGLTR